MKAAARDAAATVPSGGSGGSRGSRERLAEYREGLRRWAPSPAIATGGTLRALARLVAAERGRDPNEIYGVVLDADTLRDLSRKLVASTQEERLAMLGKRCARRRRSAR